MLLMGKAISMAISNSYVSLPEGVYTCIYVYIYTHCICTVDMIYLDESLKSKTWIIDYTKMNQHMLWS